MRSVGDASPCGAASEVLVGLVNRTEARPTARTPIRTSASMIKAHFMDEHPIRTSTSMKQRHFMDKHPIRTSMSMEQRHFMDEKPIDDCLATPGCHREASRRGCRAEVRPKHRQETGLTPVPDSLAT